MYLHFPFRFQAVKLNEENSRPYGRLEGGGGGGRRGNVLKIEKKSPDGLI